MTHLTTGGVLTGAAIRAAIDDGRIEIDPWVPEHVGPNSVDLRLGSVLKIYQLNRPDQLPRRGISGDDGKVYAASISSRDGGMDIEDRILDMRRANPTIDLEIPQEGLVMAPGILYLGCTVERTKSDHFIPKVEGRSSVGRLGIKVHLTAGFGDIGFDGRWTLEIEVTHPIRVYAGERICQVYFTTPHGPIGELYHGRYQGDLEPRASLFHLPNATHETKYVHYKRICHVPGRGFMIEVHQGLVQVMRLCVGDHIKLGKRLDCTITGIEGSTVMHDHLGLYISPRDEDGRNVLKILTRGSES